MFLCARKLARRDEIIFGTFCFGWISPGEKFQGEAAGYLETLQVSVIVFNQAQWAIITRHREEFEVVRHLWAQVALQFLFVPDPTKVHLV